MLVSGRKIHKVRRTPVKRYKNRRVYLAQSSLLESVRRFEAALMRASAAEKENDDNPKEGNAAIIVLFANDDDDDDAPRKRISAREHRVKHADRVTFVACDYPVNVRGRKNGGERGRSLVLYVPLLRASCRMLLRKRDVSFGHEDVSRDKIP